MVTKKKTDQPEAGVVPVVETAVADIAPVAAPVADPTKPFGGTPVPNGVDADRWARWVAYLTKSRAERPLPEGKAIFDAQLSRGEFNVPSPEFK